MKVNEVLEDTPSRAFEHKNDCLYMTIENHPYRITDISKDIDYEQYKKLLDLSFPTVPKYYKEHFIDPIDYETIKRQHGRVDSEVALSVTWKQFVQKANFVFDAYLGDSQDDFKE